MDTPWFGIKKLEKEGLFDISQTDGKEIPTIGVDELSGDVDRFSAFMAALTEVCPVPIAFEHIPGDTKGYYSQTEKRIAIQEGMSEVQTVKTALHEFEYDYGVRPNRIAMGFNMLRELHKMFHIGMPMNLDNLAVEYEGIPINIDYINLDNLEVGYMSKWE